MSTEIQVSQLLAKLSLPAQDLSVLGFCNASKPAAVVNWAASLPAIQVEQTGVLLYRALPEVSRLKTSADNRLEMLEALRPYVQQCIQGLAREFLNQPLLMAEKQLKTAVVAQALQKHMTNGYMLVVHDLAKKYREKRGADKNLILSCHRSISGCALLVLRSYQLYTQVPSRLWLELHSLYLLAELMDFAGDSINDDLLQFAPACSVQQAYLRALLLACSRPNQMRQNEVSAAFEILEDWVQFTRLVSPDQLRQHQKQQPKQHNLFIVNLSSDMGPMYKSRFTGASEQIIRELDLSQLITALQHQQEQKESSRAVIKIPKTLPSALIEHLKRTWSESQLRSFDRQPSKAHIEICVGLKNIHRQITNGIEFEDFLGNPYGDDEEPANDPWATDFNAPGTATLGDKNNGALYNVRVIDTSPGGYCLEWREEIPNQVKAGELLGLREQGRHRWGLGVIRWIQQRRSATRLGIQLLAPKSTPYGAAMQQPNGDYSDYMRVLMLPELKAANQPATLLTASMPFQEYNKIVLNHQGQVQDAQLNRRLFATGSISQFSFRLAAASQTQANAAPTETEETEDFSSVWEEDGDI